MIQDKIEQVDKAIAAVKKQLILLEELKEALMAENAKYEVVKIDSRGTGMILENGRPVYTFYSDKDKIKWFVRHKVSTKDIFHRDVSHTVTMPGGS